MRCTTAETETNDEYFCTRLPGHTGPCAAWPFRDLVKARIATLDPKMRHYLIDWLEDYANLST